MTCNLMETRLNEPNFLWQLGSVAIEAIVPEKPTGKEHFTHSKKVRDFFRKKGILIDFSRKQRIFDSGVQDFFGSEMLCA